MADHILSATNISKHFGGFVALEGVDFHVATGERVGLLGPNGSGKSTLVNCLTGTLRNDTGEIMFLGERIEGLVTHQRIRRGVARTFQIPRPFRSMTVLENVEIALLYAGHATSREGHTDEAFTVLDQLGLRNHADMSAGQLTQVDLRKLELARALAARPKLLIADEAMAGLSHAEVDEILKLLFQLNGAGISIVMIEHIMYAVMKFSQRIAVLVAGRKIADGDPQAVVKNPDVEKAYLGE
ncbi:MAG TPA: ABC transporter ATP-binding protein [Alphaproteobacteria bacterium]|nr:ABC transporter ATP-binding protein [Alphaproteobacteria bacterium]